MAVFFVGMLAISLICNIGEKERTVMIIWSLVLLVIGLVQVAFLKIIEIDMNDGVISVTNFSTRKKRILDLTEVDAYEVVIKTPARGKSYRELRLLKNDKTILKISGQYYSNINELESGLKGIKYLGETERSFF